MARARYGLLLGCLIFFVAILYAARSHAPSHLASVIHGATQLGSFNKLHSASRPQSGCRGARGHLIHDDSSGDIIHPSFNLVTTHRLQDGDQAYPQPTYGSHDTLEMEKSWMTFSQRYGPYGYGEDEDDYPFTRADWTSFNWAELQDQCYTSQPDQPAQGHYLQEAMGSRFRLAHQPQPEQPAKWTRTGRQAIVIRTWSSYQWVEEDFWNVRSIITEAGLAGNGTFTVFLLVDVKRDDGPRIHYEEGFYHHVKEQSVPREFWDISVLFHESLQQSWYPRVMDTSAFYQIMQPLQLFSHFYPEFDHVWQFEMDTRFLGHTGKMLHAYSEFGRKQPYKQSRERASWTYLPEVHGTYEEFSQGINESLKGGATVWGPVDTQIPGFIPFGPKPPVANASDDEFTWLAGEDADLLLFNFAFDISRVQTTDDWPFIGWHSEFNESLPRLCSFPAQGRASRALLEATHITQRDIGVRIHSEATLPSFALWHGFKIVQVPVPKYGFPERNVHEIDAIYNGGSPTSFGDGIANGAAPYRSGAVKWYTRPRTFEWSSSLIAPMWEFWVNENGTAGMVEQREEEEGTSMAMAASLRARAQETDGEIPPGRPPFLRRVHGEVYAPNFMLHPRKTNRNF